MAGTHTLTASAIGLISAQSNSFVVSAVSAAHPNEPAGMTQLTNQPWNAIPLDTAYDAYGWRREYGPGNLSIQTDINAPVSPSNILKVNFPHSMSQGGIAPCTLYRYSNVSTNKQLYIHFHIWVDPNWTNNGNVGTKLLWVRSDSGDAAHYINFCDGTTGQGSMFAIGTQFGRHSAQNQDPSSTSFKCTAANRGRWLSVECYLKMNTVLNTQDGIYKCWVDGVLISSKSNRLYAIEAGDWWWNYVRLNPTYGGGLNVPPVGGVYFYLDHIYASVGT